ncbi:cation diffusion facilitator family transporter [Anaerosphaera aminiphila DSM 21120]|uniref:Cation diffusion facilitator family transporter n=1 Tax=Anaerosphaera aminiphila DSM 21120 TaxID=1120995 RepID=A0A1M5QA89_9FIRM|nr:cation diffusion facilitator family transporter [Anaerosphaera aminiphila]SHH10423.1 cation diffusion facilitator family transporter [Anaerosphaera aminiphila DSM 21120]
MLVKKVLKMGKFGTKREDRLEISVITSVLGLASNIVLAVVKIALFVFTGSVSILADAINNATDSLSSIVTLVGVKLSAMPADKEHPYGHGRIEYISALIVAILVFYAGVEFIQTSFDRIIHPRVVEFNMYSILIMVLSMAVKLYMAHFYKEISNSIDSTPIKAQSKDSMADVFVTGVVVFSIIVNKLTGKMVDGYAGLIISLFILYSGYDLIRDTLSDLIGEAPAKGMLKEIQSIALEDKRILGVHDIIVSKYGPQRVYVSFHVEIPFNMSLVEAHSMIDKIETEIEEKLNCIVSIHVDPVGMYSETEKKIVEVLDTLIKENSDVLSFHDLLCEDNAVRVEVVVDGNTVKRHEDRERIRELVKSRLQGEFGDSYYYNIIIDRYF